MKMNYDALFKQAVHDIFNEIGISGINISSASKSSQTYDMVATIGYTGDISGYMMIQAGKGPANSLVQTMSALMGITIEEHEYKNFHKTTLGEIANQIAGRSTMLLSDNKINCDITPPSLIIGSKIHTDILNLEYHDYFKISGSFGTITCFIGIKK